MVLSLDGQGPRYAQLTRAVVGQIRRGVLSPGSRAPSSRELASELGCSRNLVLLAYEQLVTEGYFVTRQRTGTFIAAGPWEASTPQRAGHLDSSAAKAPPELSEPGRRLVRAAAGVMGPIRHRPVCPIDFIYGLCEPDDRLLRSFRRCLSRPLRERAFSYGPPAGDAGLRQQIAMRLRSARGISRPAEQVVLTSGTQQALDICARLLLGPGVDAVVEDPGYEVARASFLSTGSGVLAAPVDGEGLDPASLPGGGRPIRLVYVTPSHQVPTGAVMPAARRQALVAWARRARAYVFEDDYDGEFRYVGQPIPALAGLDPETVIYCGTFAKSLFPSCRLGYLVVPPALVGAAVQCKWLADRGSSRLVERAIGELLAAGHYDRHVRRMQRRYRERRDVLVRSLRAHLGAEVEIQGSSAGLHLVAWLPALAEEAALEVVALCRERGVGVYPMARHAVRPPGRAALLLGYGLVDAGAVERGVRELADAYRRVRRSRTRRNGHLTHVR